MSILYIKNAETGEWEEIPSLTGPQGPEGPQGEPGVEGFSPVITENADNTEEIYKLDIETKDGTFTTPNLKGESGANIVVDDALDASSVNPIQNKTVTEKFDEIDERLGELGSPTPKGYQYYLRIKGQTDAWWLNTNIDNDYIADALNGIGLGEEENLSGEWTVDEAESNYPDKTTTLIAFSMSNDAKITVVEPSVLSVTKNIDGKSIKLQIGSEGTAYTYEVILEWNDYEAKPITTYRSFEEFSAAKDIEIDKSSTDTNLLLQIVNALSENEELVVIYEDDIKFIENGISVNALTFVKLANRDCFITAYLRDGAIWTKCYAFTGSSYTSTAWAKNTAVYDDRLNDESYNAVQNYVVANEFEKIERNYALKTYVDDQISKAAHLTKEIVNEAPSAANAQENVIYMVKDTSATSGDIYKEYMLVSGQVVQTGDTSVDLTGYAKIDDEAEGTDATWSGKKIAEELSKSFDNLTEEQKASLKGEAGEKGEQGETGEAGKSTYQVWLDAGNTGSEEDFLNSLKGTDGFSPVVTVEEIEGGHKVSIEDATGVKEFDVLDGEAADSSAKTHTTLDELGLTADATIDDVKDALSVGETCMIRTDAFTDSTQFADVQWGYLKITKTVNGMCEIWLNDVTSRNSLYYGRQLGGKFDRWQKVSTEQTYRIITQGTAGYFKFKPCSNPKEQGIRITATDNYGGMIDISGVTPNDAQYKPFKAVRLSNSTYASYDAANTTNNKMKKLYLYDGYMYLQVETYTTVTFTNLIEEPTFVETIDTNAEEILIRSVFDIPYNDGYADPSIRAIGDAVSADGVIQTLNSLGFTGDVMTWDTGEYRVSHVGGLTNLPTEITEEKPGFRLAHYDVKKWGNNHNPYVSTYGCRQSVLHYKGDVFVRYTESGATAGVLITDTGWRKISCGKYYSINQLNSAKGESIELVKGEDNTQKIMDALGVGDSFICLFHNNSSMDRFGIPTSIGDKINELHIKKIPDANGVSNYCVATAFMNTGVVLNRTNYGGTLSDWCYDKTKATLVTNTTTLKLDVTKKNSSWYGAIKLTFLYDTSPVDIEISFRSTTEDLRWAVISGQKYINKITYTQDSSNTAHYTIGIEFAGTTYGCYQADVIGGFADINSLTSEAFTGAKTAVYYSPWGKNNGVTLVSAPEDIGLTFPCTSVQLVQAMRNKFNKTITSGAIGVFNNGGKTVCITDAPSDYGLLHIECFGHDRLLIRYDGISGSSYAGSWIGKIAGSNGTFSGITWERINKSYSTTEEAIGTWIDGKTIYRKSYSFEINDTFISKTLETVAIDNIIKVYGSCGGGSSLMRPVPYDGRTSQTDYSGANTSTSTEYSEVFYQASDTTLRFTAKSQSSMAKAVVVVEYTKA